MRVHCDDVCNVYAYIILLRSVFEHATTDYGNHKYRVTFFYFFSFFLPVKLVDHYLHSGTLKIFPIVSLQYLDIVVAQVRLYCNARFPALLFYGFRVVVGFSNIQHRRVVIYHYHFILWPSTVWAALSALDVRTLIFSRKSFVRRSIIIFIGVIQDTSPIYEDIYFRRTFVLDRISFFFFCTS